MSAVTAMLFAGSSHVNDGGLRPTGSPILLNEGSRAAWAAPHEIARVRDRSVSTPQSINIAMSRFTLVPASPETILDSGLLLLAARRLGLNHNNPFFDIMINKEGFDLESDLNEFPGGKKGYLDILKTAQEFCPKEGKKVLLSVMHGSSLQGNISTLQNWPNLEVEVLETKYLRSYSSWSNSIFTLGSLG